MVADLSPCASGAAAPYLDALVLASSGVPETLSRWMDERDRIAEGASTNVEAAIRKLAERLGDELRRWVAEGGDNVRGRVLAMSLRDALAIVDAVADDDGLPLLSTARKQWADSLADLAQLALDSTADAAGLKVDGLDVESWVQVQRGALENAASTWDTKIRRILGDAVLRASSDAVTASPSALRQSIASMVEDLSPTMVTEARTATAAYDRTVSAAIADEIDPAGDAFVWVYSGPVDGLQRPFCSAATGHSFTRSQVARLRNGTPGMPVVDFGGGYNCRHRWLQMTAGQAKRAGYDAADEADIMRINIFAMGKRR